MTRVETLVVLEGENEERRTHERMVREECFECGEPAHFKVTFVLKNARCNPESSGYGEDDLTWCQDACRFACREHVRGVECIPSNGQLQWCATFPATAGYAHLFLRWEKIDA